MSHRRAIHVDADGPFDGDAMLRYFAPRAIRGVEAVDGATYRRTTAEGALAVRVRPAGVRASLADRARPRSRADRRGDPASDAGCPTGVAGRTNLRQARRDPSAQALRRLFGLDGAHGDALAALRRDPIVGRRVRAAPGLRVPGTWDPFETGVRAIIGQQVSVAGASTVTARVVARHGERWAGDGDSEAAAGLTHRFPPPSVLAEGDLDGLGLTGARITAIQGWAAAVASGDVVLDRSTPLDALVASITAVRGLGPWTAHYLALRIGYPDAFPAADLGLQRSAGLDARALAVAAERWRPFRALAAVHLWQTP